MWRIFDKRGRENNEEHEKIKACASELLSLYAILRHWCECRLPRRPDIQEQKDVFLQACEAVDVKLLAKRGPLPMTDAVVRLRALMSAHLAGGRAHQRCRRRQAEAPLGIRHRRST